MHMVIAEIVARLEVLGFPVWVADATGVESFPYILLLPPGGEPADGVTLAGDRSPVSDTLRVRPVGVAAEQVSRLQARTRTVLTNNGGPLHFAAPGWRVSLVRSGALPMTVDRDVTTTGENAHPLFVTDEYELTAVPLPVPAPTP